MPTRNQVSYQGIYTAGKRKRKEETESEGPSGLVKVIHISAAKSETHSGWESQPDAHQTVENATKLPAVSAK